MTRERMEERLREREQLFKLLHQRLTYEEFRVAEEIILGYLGDAEAEMVNGAVKLGMASEQYSRLEEDYAALLDTLEKVSATCLERNFTAVRPHFMAWGTTQEARECAPRKTEQDIRQQFHKRMADLCPGSALPPDQLVRHNN